MIYRIRLNQILSINLVYVERIAANENPYLNTRSIMTDEEFIKKFGKAFVDQWLNDVDNAVLMTNFPRVEEVKASYDALRKLFSDDDATTIELSREEEFGRAMTIEIRSPAVLLSHKELRDFLVALSRADYIDICASQDEKAVINLEFSNCFIKIGNR